ncbi:zinc-ribbon domain-containing protein [uncultured Lacinutrix sp.]|uniref:zinc-ribbon domain-containing protein n=1 Tax=uncultured Lacinutrix sp. TaxID=574032 RepID=UPI002630874C|nr:zinc-ribbon domain-containing protein [uncultured Lacinutrix sp.]
MIFYGTNASRLKDGRLSNVTCPNCDNQTHMTYSVFGKYAYIYWIPFFPIGKENILECDSCKKTFKLKELPQQIQNKFELEKHTGVPIKHFAGFGVIAIIIAFVMYSSSQNKANNLKYINAPEIGDVYSIDGSEKGYYSTMRVKEVTSDSIYLIVNDYEVDKKSGINDIDVDKNYTNEEYHISKAGIIELYNNETIFEIDRD